MNNRLLVCEDCGVFFPHLKARKLHMESRIHKRNVERKASSKSKKKEA